MVVLDANALQDCRIIGAFKKGFILVESSDKVLLFVDQHAADERINLERVCREQDKHVLQASEQDQLVACMSAVKLTDQTTTDKQLKIVNELLKCEFPFACAHGRPTIIALE